jgi:hypothetical protein
MAQTITEALQELKTLQARLLKKRAAILGFLARDSRIKDPLEKEQGGSQGWIERERQAIADLETRVVMLRTAIQTANLNTPCEVGKVTRSVAEWLTWRREISDGSKAFLNSMSNQINKVRADLQGRNRNVGLAIAQAGAESAPPDVVVTLNERKLLTEQELMEEMLGDLDGRLSLLNATTTIDV